MHQGLAAHCLCTTGLAYVLNKFMPIYNLKKYIGWCITLLSNISKIMTCNFSEVLRGSFCPFVSDFALGLLVMHLLESYKSKRCSQIYFGFLF